MNGTCINCHAQRIDGCLFHRCAIHCAELCRGKCEEFNESLALDEPTDLDSAGKLAALIAASETSLSQLDELATIWGDEVVFRRCRDRLRAALAEAKS